MAPSSYHTAGTQGGGEVTITRSHSHEAATPRKNMGATVITNDINFATSAISISAAALILVIKCTVTAL